MAGVGVGVAARVVGALAGEGTTTMVAMEGGITHIKLQGRAAAMVPIYCLP